MSELRVFRGYAVAAVLALAACGGQIDPNATQKASAPQTGTDAVPVPTATGTAVPLPLPSAGSGGPPNAGPCGGKMIPFEDDFEDGTIDAMFTVNSPSAFEVDYAAPITGAASLHVKPTKASFIARKMANLCKARLQFNFRASAGFLESGGNLARINAGSRRFTVVIQPGGGIAKMEEVYGTVASGGGGGGPIGVLGPDAAATISVEFDLVNETTTLSFSSHVTGAAAAVGDKMLPTGDGDALQSPPAISSIELGTTPGIASDPRGDYWIDDISIQ